MCCFVLSLYGIVGTTGLDSSMGLNPSVNFFITMSC